MKNKFTVYRQVCSTQLCMPYTYYVNTISYRLLLPACNHRLRFIVLDEPQGSHVVPDEGVPGEDRSAAENHLHHYARGLICTCPLTNGRACVWAYPTNAKPLAISDQSRI